MSLLSRIGGVLKATLPGPYDPSLEEVIDYTPRPRKEPTPEPSWGKRKSMTIYGSAMGAGLLLAAVHTHYQEPITPEEMGVLIHHAKLASGTHTPSPSIADTGIQRQSLNPSLPKQGQSSKITDQMVLDEILIRTAAFEESYLGPEAMKIVYASIDARMKEGKRSGCFPTEIIPVIYGFQEYHAVDYFDGFHPDLFRTDHKKAIETVRHEMETGVDPIKDYPWLNDKARSDAYAAQVRADAEKGLVEFRAGKMAFPHIMDGKGPLMYENSDMVDAHGNPTGYLAGTTLPCLSDSPVVDITPADPQGLLGNLRIYTVK